MSVHRCCCVSPGAWNFKTDPPKPLKLIYDDGKTQLLEKLQQIRSVSEDASSLLTATSKPEVVMRQSPLFDHMKDDYDDMGNVEEVAKHCPFIGHTLATVSIWWATTHAHDGGALRDTTEPSKTIHRLCEKNEFYDREETEAELSRCRQAAHCARSARIVASTFMRNWKRLNAARARTLL